MLDGIRTLTRQDILHTDFARVWLEWLRAESTLVELLLDQLRFPFPLPTLLLLSFDFALPVQHFVYLLPASSFVLSIGLRLLEGGKVCIWIA